MDEPPQEKSPAKIGENDAEELPAHRNVAPDWKDAEDEPDHERRLPARKVADDDPEQVKLPPKAG